MSNNLAYTRCGDYDIPYLRLTSNTAGSLGKYGRMRKQYLQEHRQVLWNSMILSETLYPHPREIDVAANRRLEQLMPELMKQNGVTESLRASNQIAWVGAINSIRNQA